MSRGEFAIIGTGEVPTGNYPERSEFELFGRSRADAAAGCRNRLRMLRRIAHGSPVLVGAMVDPDVQHGGD